MLTRYVIDAIFGCVEFTAENGFIERFVNICTAESIPLWDMHKLGGKMTAKTTINGYKKIRTVARRSSMKVRMKKKSGLPFVINRNIQRKGLVIGFAALVLIMLLLSGRVWVIEIDDEKNFSRHTVVEAFENAGLKTGSKIKNLDIVKIENEAILNLDDASWAAINFKGCVAEIKIRKLREKPGIETHTGYSNIVASKDGQIEVLEVYRGSAATTHGQTVTKGDLIISGVTESKTQLNLFTDADGYIVAKTSITVDTHSPKTVTELIPKAKKVWSFYFLGIEILPPGKEDGICYEHRERLVIKGKVLPFGINYRQYTTFTEKEKTISTTEAALMAINDYALESYNKTLHTQIIEQDVVLTETDIGFDVSGKYSCYENIGKSILLEIEETEESAE